MLSGRGNTLGLVTSRKNASKDAHGNPTRAELFMHASSHDRAPTC